MNFNINIEDLKKQIEAFKRESAELGRVINPILDKFELNNQELLEVCQIGKFAFKIDSEIRILDKPQPPNPDFIIQFNQKSIGLEHTQILTDDASRFFKVKSLFDYAEQIFRKKYPNINVHASLSVKDDCWDYRQKDKPKLAEKVADFVHWKMCGLNFNFPDKITEIRTDKHSQVSFTYAENNWQAAYLTKERLQAEIGKKEGKISGYKKSDKKLAELWLVLLIGSLSSVSYELNEEVNYEMESEFDRVYLMTDYDARIIRVK